MESCSREGHERAWFEKGRCAGVREVEETAAGKTAVKRLFIVVVYVYVCLSVAQLLFVICRLCNPNVLSIILVKTSTVL